MARSLDAPGRWQRHVDPTTFAILTQPTLHSLQDGARTRISRGFSEIMKPDHEGSPGGGYGPQMGTHRRWVALSSQVIGPGGNKNSSQFVRRRPASALHEQKGLSPAGGPPEPR